MNPTDFKNLDAQAIELIYRFLPQSLKPVEKLIGLKQTLALVYEFGGQVFVIPKRQNGPATERFTEIAKVIGVNETLLLGKYFGSDNFYIPRCLQLSLVLRDRDITRYFDALLKKMGALRAANELAKRYRMTARQIEMIVNGKDSARNPYKRDGAKIRNQICAKTIPNLCKKNRV